VLQKKETHLYSGNKYEKMQKEHPGSADWMKYVSNALSPHQYAKQELMYLFSFPLLLEKQQKKQQNNQFVVDRIIARSKCCWQCILYI
jgi:hypothetical protein